MAGKLEERGTDLLEMIEVFGWLWRRWMERIE